MKEGKMQRVNVLLVDDLDGTEAVSTVVFGIDGSHYEIDLSSQHEEELRKVLDDYVTHARKASNAPRKGNRVGRAERQTHNEDAREWAKAQGIEVKDRGRVPTAILKGYEDSRRTPPVAKAETPPKAPESPKAKSVTLPSTDEIRAWLKANGHPVKDNGRIAATLVDTFKRGNGIPVS
jgi:hypothetical protein